MQGSVEAIAGALKKSVTRKSKPVSCTGRRWHHRVRYRAGSCRQGRRHRL
ncbi:hypothetical protein [Bradyrhizobium sp. RDI18]